MTSKLFGEKSPRLSQFPQGVLITHVPFLFQFHHHPVLIRNKFRNAEKPCDMARIKRWLLVITSEFLPLLRETFIKKSMLVFAKKTQKLEKEEKKTSFSKHWLLLNFFGSRYGVHQQK